MHEYELHSRIVQSGCLVPVIPLDYSKRSKEWYDVSDALALARVAIWHAGPG